MENLIKNLVLTMCLFVAATYFLAFCSDERRTGSKLSQFIAGIPIHMYWSLTYIFDLFVFLIIVLLTMAVPIYLVASKSAPVGVLGPTFLMFLAFAIAILFSMYVFSLVFTYPIQAFQILLTVGLSLIMINTIIYALSFKMKILAVCSAFLQLYPAVALHASLTQFDFVANCLVTKKKCLDDEKDEEICNLCFEGITSPCCNAAFLSWKYPGSLGQLLILIASAIFYMGILYLCDYKKLRCKSCGKDVPDVSLNEEDDVKKEREKVFAMKVPSIGVLAYDICKFYKRFLAVRNVSFVVNPGECFGLLGTNGAGKSSIFKMLTNVESVTFGDAWVNEMLVSTFKFKNFGYCPQFDQVLDNFTARQTLKIFGQIRGITSKDISATITNFSKDFDFQLYLDIKLKDLSGGNKRKVSVALAFIGDPDVILLDEPTTGIDPVAKRRIWANINQARLEGKAIILTSHSMEECEALCTRMAIMVMGELRCIGTKQHLKSRYQKGYTLKIRLFKSKENEETINTVKTFVKANFPHAVLIRISTQMMVFNIQDYSQRISNMFIILEMAMKKMPIEEYSFSQSSLTQVFMGFANSPVSSEKEP